MIWFKKLRFRNLMSFGNYWTELDLDPKVATLIWGTNGVGKSTILDCLCFGLFNKPFKNITHSQIPNSINNADCLVEIEFEIGQSKFLVRRGLRPRIFEIYQNGTLLNQDAKAKSYQDQFEETILKMNYKSFTQVIILGSASFVPFMELSKADRRAVIEDLLDIQIFSKMNIVLRQKYSQLKDRLQQTDYTCKLLQEKIKLQRCHIDDLKTQKLDLIESNNKKIAENQTQIEVYQCEISDKRKDIQALMVDTTDQTKTLKALEDLKGYASKIERNYNKTTKELDFFENNDTCPTCQQKIEEAFKSEHVTKIKENQEKYKDGLDKIEDDMQKFHNKLVVIEETLSKIEKIEQEIQLINTKILASNTYIAKIQKEISELQNKNEVVDSDAIAELQNLENSLSAIQKELESMRADEYNYDIIGSLLKDGGIKRKIIRQYIPIINQCLKKYLDAMDFFVEFALDEDFNEKVKSRKRDEFTYASFSEGEKMRINLALLFCWREIAKRKNSANCNLLIFDEVLDSSLDGNGIDEFFKLLTLLGSSTSVFVISHRDSMIDKFNNAIAVKKIGDFSKMELS